MFRRSKKDVTTGFPASELQAPEWKKRVVDPDQVLERIRPGMRIFLSTGVAEPRSLVKHLLESRSGNLNDLEWIQLISFGEAVSADERYSHKFRLKTFFAGWVASEGITAGRVDLIPCPFSRIPELVESGAMPVDAAFVQISPPNEVGFASLGMALDAARQAMEKAELVVGEINPDAPRTMGDTLVHVDEFDLFVESREPLIYLDRWPVDPVYDRVAAHLAALIEDGDCLGFALGPLFEALSRQLTGKSDLGIHSVFMTDALMDLIRSGAVNNRRKGVFKRKSLVSYAFGTPVLKNWLHRNPLVEFQGIDVVADSRTIGSNDNYKAVLPARKVDLTGGVALHTGKGNVAASQGAVQEIMIGTRFSRNGRVIFALPSRNRDGCSNILLSVRDYPNQLQTSEWVDFIVTEFGTAYLAGRTIRERALALIDIAHPEDRAGLVEQAKIGCLLYPDQIYLRESGHLYPEELCTTHVLKDGLKLRFRPIRPSDEEQMRRLFYRFSDESVYYRYFSPIKTMPHSRMQEYVNVDYVNVLSMVGLVGEPGAGYVVAEARMAKLPDRPYADTAFIVDEQYQGRGVATFLLNTLIRIAQERGLKGICADVLPDNRAMWKVYEKAPYPLKVRRETDSYHLEIDFTGAK